MNEQEKNIIAKLETEILATVIDYPEYFGQVNEVMQVADFYFETHKTIYSVLENAFNDDVSFSITLLTANYPLLMTNAVIEQFTQIIMSGGNRWSLDENIEKLKQFSTMRVLKELLESVDGEFRANKFEDALTNIEHKFYKTTQLTTVKKVDYIKEFYEGMFTQQNRLKFGYNTIDYKTNGGFREGDLVILAGRPGMAKTTMALNLFYKRIMTKDNDKLSLFFSLEMTASQVFGKLVSIDSGVNVNKDPKLLTAEEVSAIGISVDKLEKMRGERYEIFDENVSRPGQIRAKIRRIANKKNVDAIYIDYLQLMDTGKNKGIYETVTEISKSLKVMAKEFKCPLFALSQLSRAVEERQDKHPMLSDLRDSGSIEQDADVVIMLYREDYYSKNTPGYVPTNIIDIDFAKFRGGEPGMVQMFVKLDQSKFFDIYQGV